MAQAQGYRAQLGLDFETTFATTPTTPNGIMMPIESSKIVAKQSLIEDKTIRGIRDAAQPALGNIDVSGSVVVPLDEIGIGYWLRAMFGAPTTTGSADPYTHVFKPGFTQPSLVLEQAFPDIGKYFLYNGCKVNKFSTSFEVNNNQLSATIEVMGAKETIGSAPFDISLTVNSLLKFGNFQAAIKEGGATLATVTKVDLNVDMGLDGSIYTLGCNGFRGNITEGLMNISGTVTALFDSVTLLNKAVNGTTSSIELTVTSGTHSLDISLPEVIYERTSPTIEGAKGILLSMPFRAYYNTNVSGTSIVATLVNGQTSYA